MIATVTSAGRDRMARCGVWMGLSEDLPPHMPLDLTMQTIDVTPYATRIDVTRGGGYDVTTVI